MLSCRKSVRKLCALLDNNAPGAHIYMNDSIPEVVKMMDAASTLLHSYLGWQPEGLIALLTASFFGVQLCMLTFVRDLELKYKVIDG